MGEREGEPSRRMPLWRHCPGSCALGAPTQTHGCRPVDTSSTGAAAARAWGPRPQPLTANTGPNLVWCVLSRDHPWPWTPHRALSFGRTFWYLLQHPETQLAHRNTCGFPLMPGEHGRLLLKRSLAVKGLAGYQPEYSVQEMRALAPHRRNARTGLVQKVNNAWPEY